MSNDLTDKDPFAEDEEEDKVDLISEAMVKKATWLIHKLAEQRKQDFKEIQKKCKKKFAYSNLAKISMEEGHAIIDKLIELTGGEEETPQLSTKTSNEFKTNDKGTAKIEEPKNEEKEIVTIDDDDATMNMRKSIRAAVDITLKEVVEKDVPVQGLGGFVLEIGKVLFEAKMAEKEASK